MLSSRPEDLPKGDPRDRGKQAVVLIHGIGEQRPMDSLRGFASTVWDRDEAVKHEYARAGLWSKPDHLSGSFELRRLTTSKNVREVSTDFFELYWAHLMQGTRLSQVWAWMKLLLFRSPRSVPRRLRSAWFVCWIAVGVVALLALNFALPEGDRWIEIPRWLGTLVTGAAAWVSGAFVIKYLGDAARYLNPAPDNVQARHAIRTAGVELIHALHDSGEYGRIVLVGHSLGSVVGLDVLTHAWPRYNGRIRAVDPQPRTFLDHLVQRMARDGGPEAGDGQDGSEVDVQDLQRLYLDELHDQRCPWLVTDFVTLGSPLAHPELVMARDADEFGRKTRDRELPTCPPTPDDLGFTYVLRNELAVPHHAAVFGPTRWTNLHMPARALLFGDLISGPVGGDPEPREGGEIGFGQWIRDVSVGTTARGGLLGHTLYWRGNDDSDHIEALRRACRIDEGPRPWLRAEAELAPAEGWSEDDWLRRSLSLEVAGRSAPAVVKRIRRGSMDTVEIAWAVQSRSHRELGTGARFRVLHRGEPVSKGELVSTPRLDTVRPWASAGGAQYTPAP